MAVRDIIVMGNPLLRRRADPIEDPTAPEVAELVKDLIDTMDDSGGIGLAAPQIGISKRVVVFYAPPDEPLEKQEDILDEPVTVLINPEIEPLTAHREAGWEGCLSVPGLRGMVRRCTHIRYSGIDEKGERIEREARDFHARVVQHECDHLDGILYPYRMTDLTTLIYESEYERLLRAAEAAPA